MKHRNVNLHEGEIIHIKHPSTGTDLRVFIDVTGETLMVSFNTSVDGLGFHDIGQTYFDDLGFIHRGKQPCV